MRKYLLLFVALYSAVYSQAQWVTIPDWAFANELARQYPGCMNGNQMDTTCPDIVNDTLLQCVNLGIADLNGLQYFDNLKYFDAWQNNLTSVSPTLFPQSPFPASLKELNLSSNSHLLLTDETLPAGLNTLNCSINTYGTLPLIFPPALKLLNCQVMTYPNLTNLPDSLESLNCGCTLLDSLPANLPPNLKELYCFLNYLTSLPPLPSSLTTLYCRYNNLTNLPAMPAGLTFLDCSDNELINLPALPNSLKHLDCSTNQITILPALHDSLTYLDCSRNRFSNLAAIPPNLQTLICAHNPILSLPALPNSLKYLDYSFDSIPAASLPPYLTHLDCSGTHSTVLPLLPATLRELNCFENSITSLPQLPDSLIQLNCRKNSINLIPALPATLRYLTCSYNSLTNLPELPDSLFTLDCRNNPNLHCLPQLKYIEYLYIDTINFQCIPDYGHIVNDYNHLLSKPLCDLFNNNGCPLYWNITGQVYKDENSNCTRQATEARAYNTKLMLYRNGSLEQQTYTYNNGLYSFDTDMGTYTVKLDTTGLPFIVSCPANGIDTARVIPADSLLYNKDFALQCKPGFDLGIYSLLPVAPFQPAVYTYVILKAGDFANYYNLTCNTTGLSGNLTITLNGPVSFAAPAAGALTPTSIAGNIITYNISDWSAINPATAFNFIIQTDTFAQLTQQACIDVSLQPSAGDNNTANNVFNACYPIRAAYDPNEKEVQPKGVIDNNAQWLTYTIRFQNTGTAAAQHIYIEDTLSANLDLTTFQLLNYSHEPLTQVYNINNRLRFNFPNIGLPDSLHNEPDSHGYVQFRIKTKPGLYCGDSIADPAYIYFDYNAPVVTNAPVTNIKYYEQAAVQRSSCNGQPYNFYGQLLSLPGNYTDTVQTPQTCDSIITLQLSLGAATNASVTQSICNGQQYNFYGTNLNIAGDYQQTLTNSAGCDSVVTLHLAVTQPTTADVSNSICNGEQFDFYGTALTAAGSYQHTLSNSAGCDSVVTLHLAMLQTTSAEVTQSICNGQQYDFYGTNLNTAGDYQHTLSNSAGCDSVVTLHLAMLQATSAEVTQSICNGQQYNFYGTNLNTAGDYQQTLTNSAGCDSVVNLTLLMVDNSNTVIDTFIAQGDHITLPWGGVANTPGTYSDTLQSSMGCDSVITVNVAVLSGISAPDNSSYLRLVPNPAHNQVSLVVSINFVGSQYRFTNILGQVMFTGQIEQANTILNTTTLPAGVYLVQIGNVVKRLVKE